MIDGDLGTDVDEIVRAHAELLQFPLGLDLGYREMTAVSLGQALDLGRAGAELQGGIAVLLRGLLCDHLAIVDLQHRDGHLLPFIGVDPSHSQFLCDETRTHRFTPQKLIRA